MKAAEQFIREQSVRTVREYERRVYRLGAIYLLLVVTCAIAIVLIIVWGKFFVTLAQRTNVETLTLALILLLFGYLAVVSAPGAWGALKIVWYNAPAWLGGDRDAAERRKQAALKPASDQPDSAYLNCIISSQSGGPDAPVTIPIRDAYGDLGVIRIDGTKMSHEGGAQHSSNSVFAFFERRIEALVRQRDPQASVQIVQWAGIDDERALQYEGVVAFSRNLQRQLRLEPLWPTVELSDEDLRILASEANALCPALRNEFHLPDLEYEANHQLPIIPEPLAFISLSRREQRADPVTSMGCALVVTLVILGFVVFFILRPPWTPAK
jgi:hypothetical protein